MSLQKERNIQPSNDNNSFIIKCKPFGVRSGKVYGSHNTVCIIHKTFSSREIEITIQWASSQLEVGHAINRMAILYMVGNRTRCRNNQSTIVRSISSGTAGSCMHASNSLAGTAGSASSTAALAPTRNLLSFRVCSTAAFVCPPQAPEGTVTLEAACEEACAGVGAAW
jgi:hypothetical protein